MLANGGSLYVDEGKPAPGLIDKTVANLRDVAPNIYFNVPRGFDVLLPFLENDETLARQFFARLRVVFYAGAALPQNLWERLERKAAQLDKRVAMVCSWGSTETTSTVTSVHFPIDRAGVIGIPAPGCELLMQPNGDKLEMRVRGPNVTPGYFKRPDLTAEAYETAVEVQARLARHVPSSLGQGLVVQPGERFETVEGVVRGLGLHDELAGTMYAVVERSGGGACYLPVRPEVAAQLALGDNVRVSSPTESWVKASDRIVARYAAEHGGVYDPAGHERELVDPRRQERERATVARRPGEGQRAAARAAGTVRPGRAAAGRSVARARRPREPAGGPRTDASATPDQVDRLGPKRQVDRSGPDRGPGPRPRTGVVAMSLFDERALREIVADELRRVLREELASGGRPANDAEYLPVAEAAARASVAPATIRVWMAQGRLGRYHAGRELRVLASSLQS